MLTNPKSLLLLGLAIAAASDWRCVVFSELGLGYVPCMLCLWQRIPYYVAGVASAGGACS